MRKEHAHHFVVAYRREATEHQIDLYHGGPICERHEYGEYECTILSRRTVNESRIEKTTATCAGDKAICLLGRAARERKGVTSPVPLTAEGRMRRS